MTSDRSVIYFTVGFRYVECGDHGPYDPNLARCPDCSPLTTTLRVTAINYDRGTITVESIKEPA